MRCDGRKIPPHDLRTYRASHAIRLADCDYAGNIDIHVTLCARGGTPFHDDLLAAMICENVECYCRRLDYKLCGYCLMPDHLHVLLSPAGSRIALAQWLDRFKSFTTHMFMEMGRRPPLWQRSAYDRVCRNEEAAETVLAYIVENPVRKELVERWQDWPWTKTWVEV